MLESAWLVSVQHTATAIISLFNLFLNNSENNRRESDDHGPGFVVNATANKLFWRQHFLERA